MSSYEIPVTAITPGSVVIPASRRLSTRWISVLTLVALVAIWWAVTATGMIEPLFLPPPSAVLQKGWLLVTTGYMDSTLWQHLGASLSRIGLGLGFMVQSAAQFLVTDVVVLGILVIALIAFAMEMGLRALQRKLVPWHGQAH